MAVFDFKKYKQDKNDAQLNAFYKYLYDSYCGGNEDTDFDNEYFEILNEDELLQSLIDYINSNYVTSQTRAYSYINEIVSFFDYLREYHSITNPIFQNKDQEKSFRNQAKTIISKLKETASKGFISDSEFEKLNTGIAEHLQDLDKKGMQSIYDELERKYQGEKEGVRVVSKEYYNFVSIITTKLAMNYGLSNIDTANLKLTDLNLNNKTLTVNGFLIPLDDKMVELLAIYLGFREKILSLHSAPIDFLFISNYGMPLLTPRGNADNSKLYEIMNKKIGHRRANELAARCIVKMLENGLDFATVSELTYTAYHKLAALWKEYNKDKDKNLTLRAFFKNGSNRTTKRIAETKGRVKCCYCGKEFSNNSENWVLAQFYENDDNHIACKDCKGGKDGKIRY